MAEKAGEPQLILPVTMASRRSVLTAATRSVRPDKWRKLGNSAIVRPPTL